MREKINQIIKLLDSLDLYEKNYLFIKLFENETIDYIDISTSYNKYLESQKLIQRHKISDMYVSLDHMATYIKQSALKKGIGDQKSFVLAKLYYNLIQSNQLPEEAESKYKLKLNEIGWRIDPESPTGISEIIKQ